MKIKNIVIFLIIMGLATASFVRNFKWRDEISIVIDNLQKAPNNPRQIYNYATILHRQGKFEEALINLRRIIEMGRATWFVYAELGAVLADMGLYNDALYWQKKALSIEQNADAWEFIGVTYFMMGDREKAKEAFQNAIKMNKESTLAQYYLNIIEMEQQ